MISEQIDFSDFQELADTQYVYNSGGDFVRASDRDNSWYVWQNNQGFVTTTDLGGDYTDNPGGLRDFDPGHLVIDPSNDFTIGTSDFTIEAWIWLDDVPWNWSTIMSQRLSADAELSFEVQYYDDQIRVTMNDGASRQDMSIETANNPASEAQDYAQTVHTNYPTMSISPSAWHHVAVVRDDNTLAVFVDGAKVDSSATNQVDVQHSDEPVYIGAANAGGVEYPVADPLIGYMQDVRLTKQAMYVEDFDPRVALPPGGGGGAVGDPHIMTFAGKKYTL